LAEATPGVVKGAEQIGQKATWMSKMAPTIKAAPTIASKAAVPLAVAQSLYENKDEFMETGAIEPYPQFQKALKGAEQFVSLKTTWGERFFGLTDAISGMTGVLVGSLTEIGRETTNLGRILIGAEVENSLFKNNPNKQTKDWEKKKDEEVKKLEGEKLSLAQERDIIMGGAKTASSANTAGAVSDTAGVNVANTADIGGFVKNAANNTVQAVKDAANNTVQAVKQADVGGFVKDAANNTVQAVKQADVGGFVKDAANNTVQAVKQADVGGFVKDAANNTVQAVKQADVGGFVKDAANNTVQAVNDIIIRQPDNKPIPVVATDAKGDPLVPSVEVARSRGTLTANGLVSSQAPNEIKPPEFMDSVKDVAKDYFSKLSEIYEKIKETIPETVKEAVKETNEKASSFMTGLSHQDEAYTHTRLPESYRLAAQKNAGVNRGGQNTGFTHSPFGATSSAISNARGQAAAQDQIAQSNVPAPSSPMSTTPVVDQDQTTQTGTSYQGGTLSGSGLTTKSETMKSVYNSFINAGFSPNQAKAMTAEAGRENDFNAKTIFGSHTDAANKAKNIGYFSWQGKRATKLQSELEKKGLWKDGQAVQSQETLDTMAKFAKTEMESGQYKGLGNFLENKNVDSETAAKQLGKGYIKWAYGQDVLRSGEKFDWKAHDTKRKGYYDKIDKLVSSGEISSQQGSKLKETVNNDSQKITDSAQSTPATVASHGAPKTFTADNLKFKNKKEAMGGGKNEQGMLALANNIQSNVSGMKYITSMNDEYHQSATYKNKKIAAGGTGKSTHQEGTAMDFTLKDPKESAAAKKQVEEMLKSAGVEGKVIDEYKTKTAAGTGGHIHVNFKDKKEADKYAAFMSGQKPPAETPAEQPQKVSSPTQVAQNKTSPEISSTEAPLTLEQEREILMAGQLSASSANTAGAVSDTAGVNVANTADVGGLNKVAANTADVGGLNKVAANTAGAVSDRTGVNVANTAGSNLSRVSSPSVIPFNLGSSVRGGIPLSVNGFQPNLLNSISTGVNLNSLIPSLNTRNGGILESASIGDRLNDIKTAGAQAAQFQAPIINQISRGGSERSAAAGNSIPIEIRNPESSLRKLCDSLIASTFG